jgi:FkbM family methyltransferase
MPNDHPLKREARFRRFVSRVRAAVDRFRSPQKRRGQAESGPQWTTVTGGPCSGSELYLVPGAFASMIDGTYDAFIYNHLEKLGFDLRGKVVWDVGAHFGYHTLTFARLVGPAGRVLSFEPNRANAERLRLNVGRNAELAKVVRVMDFALSSLDGQETFRFSPEVDDGLSSCSYIDRGMPPGDRVPSSVYEAFESTEVKVWKADTVIGKGGCQPPAIMKIDVEGGEHQVLQGASRLLEKEKPLIAMEVHNITCMFQVLSYLLEHGYRVELLDEGARSASRCFVFAERD